MSSRYKIKKCPYCNDAWLFVSDGDYYSGYESKGFKVSCMCGFAFRNMPFMPSRESAVAEWNKYIRGLNNEQ